MRFSEWRPKELALILPCVSFLVSFPHRTGEQASGVFWAFVLVLPPAHLQADRQSLELLLSRPELGT